MFTFNSAKKFFFLLCASLLATTVSASAVYDGKDSIKVAGRGNTLQSIAADLKNPGQFSYDPKSRTAVSRYSIVVTEGAELTIGKKGDKASGEVLEINCDSLKKNSRKVFIDRGGEFNMYYSKIVGENSKINKKNYRLYQALTYYYASSGEVVDSEISSAYYAFRLYPDKDVYISGLKISDCVMAESRLANTIKDLKLSNVLYMTIGRPATYLNCDFGNATVRTKPMVKKDFNIHFNNCSFNIKKLDFKKGLPTQLIFESTQYVQVIDEQDYALSNAYIRLSGKAGNGESYSKIFSLNAGGETWLSVPYEVITKSAPLTKTKYSNKLEICLEGSGGPFKLVKEDFNPVKQGGWRIVKIKGQGFEIKEAAFVQGTQQASGSLTNLCPNSGIEIESIKGFPDYFWPRLFYQVRENNLGVVSTHTPEENSKLVYYGVSKKDPYAGENCLEIPPGMKRLYVRAFRFDFKTNPVYTVSFYAKSADGKGTFKIQAAGTFTKVFDIGDKWKRYSVVWDIGKREIKTKNKRNKCYFVLHNESKSIVWIDNIQVETGKKLHDYIPDNFKSPTHN